MESALIGRINAISDNDFDYLMENNRFYFSFNTSEELEGLQFRFVIKKIGREIFSEITSERVFEHFVDELNQYEFLVEYLVNDTVVRSTVFGEKIMGIECFEFTGCHISVFGERLECALHINSNQNLQYAYYVKRNGVVVEKIGYSSKSSFMTKINGSGNYQVKYFIKRENDERFSSSSETIETSFGFSPSETRSIGINGKYLNGLWVNNDRPNLIIVFQSIGVMNKAMLTDAVEAKNFKKYREHHKKYSWWSLTSEVEADYLFIEDYFSGAYGWYMIDQGECIIDGLNEEITNFLKDKGYRNVISFGSSKGGSGALLYGIMNPHINHVVSLVPQIKVITYIQRTMKNYYELFFPSENPELERYLNNFFFNPLNYDQQKCGDTKVFLYTGVCDTQFKEINRVSKFLIDHVASSRLLINTGKKKHTALVVDNKSIFIDILQLCVLETKLIDSRIVQLSEELYLLTDH